MVDTNQNNQLLLQQAQYDLDQEYEVEKITDMRQYQKQNKITKKFELVKEFLVKWVGYEQLTWEPLQNLDNCQEALNEYYEQRKLEIQRNGKKDKKEKKENKERPRNNNKNSVIKRGK